MKLSRLFILLVLVGLTASAALADGIDPTVVIRQVDPVPTIITDPNQIISVFAVGTLDNDGVVDVGVQNDTGLLLTSLTLTLFGLNDALDFTAGSQDTEGIFPFASSTRTANPNGTVTLKFFGIDEFHTGLLSGVCNSDSDMDADDCTGPIYSIEIAGIPAGDIVVGSGTVSAPEPASLVLLSAGLVGLAAFRKRRTALQN